ncbi:MAG: TonB-dependent receptor [Novosphingobium sp.]|nr:TonB-dependent receptor [Novosphingobium sp.]
MEIQKRKLYQKLLMAGAAIVPLGLHPVVALAQDGDQASATSDEGGLAEIVVTAQKRSESVQKVPISIAAFDTSKLTSSGISDTKMLQSVVPGLVATNTGSLTSFYLRGVGTRFAFAGLEPSVATYIDDRYVSRANASAFEFADVERIEVLKGPQGVLYGRNATGGAIRVITKDVSDHLEGEVSAGYGNYNAWHMSGTVSAPLTDDFGVRVSALVKKRDGFADNLDPRGYDEMDNLNRQAYRAKFRWNMGDSVTSWLTLEYNRRRDTAGSDVVDLSAPEGVNIGIASGGISGQSVGEVATALADPTTQKDYSANFRVEANLGAVDLTSISTYWNFRQTAPIDADGTSARLFDGTLHDKVESISQEIQLKSAASGPLDWIVGFYYLDDHIKNFDTLLDLRDLNGRLAEQGNAEVRTKAYAVFGQLDYEFTPGLSLQLGGRFSHEKKKVNVVAPQEGFIPLNFLYPYEDSVSFSKFTPKVTLSYDSADAGLFYATYSRGFKSGGFDFPASKINPLTGEPVSTLKPEVLDMFEVGWKATLFDRKVRINASAFYYDYQDLQVTRAASDPDTGAVVNLTENATTAKIKGIDLDLSWAITRELTLDASMNVLDSKYGDYVTIGQLLNSIATDNPTAPGARSVGYDASGESLLRASDFSASVLLRYTPEFSAGKIPMSVGYAYKGPFNFDFVVDPGMRRLRQKGYGLLNAQIGFEPHSADWSVTVWGENLTGKDYFDDIVGSPAGIRGSYGQPRTYGVSASYKF